MRVPSILLLCLLFLLAGSVVVNPSCGGGGSATPSPPETPDDPDDPGDPEDPPPAEPPIEWPPLDALAATTTAENDRFATSPLCARCHDNVDTSAALRDPDGVGIAPMDLWRSTAMSASARDPFWRAVVSAEAATNPTQVPVIENLCLRCHAPMAHESLAADARLSMAVLDAGGTATQLALDGGACAACHQILEGNLGEEESYTGGFEIGDQRLIFGGHPSPNPRPMSNQSGFTPVHAPHIGESALCGTCHTLETHTLAEDGSYTGHLLLEQGPYLEWRNSVFTTEAATLHADAASCADCHLPRTTDGGARIDTQIAHTPGGGTYGPGAAPVRQGVHRHLLVGGNTWLPRLLRTHRTALQPNASDAELQATEAAARDLLRNATASVAVRDATHAEGTLTFTVHVENKAGHKFPSAYPSRRAWLRVRVRDASGAVFFESGAYDDAGRLLDGDGDVHAADLVGGAVESHRTLISDPSQVQIYESIMEDAAGAPTWRLMRAARYRKDNRLLPRGWNPLHAEAERAGPRGAATEDTDFQAGSDDVAFRVSTGAHAAPFTVDVTLLYQVLGTRYASELFAVDTQAVASFRRMWEGIDRRPEIVAETSTRTP